MKDLIEKKKMEGSKNEWMKERKEWKSGKRCKKNRGKTTSKKRRYIRKNERKLKDKQLERKKLV